MRPQLQEGDEKGLRFAWGWSIVDLEEGKVKGAGTQLDSIPSQDGLQKAAVQPPKSPLVGT